ncbi:tyrosine-protein phosphatase [Thiomicrorhabdus sp. Milos-T2]|uniref:tyrosine-protein phosphatase n=1 Tax=Thiomicrorhabdus sp. Milos-T2 TaxID=90814 RepID=UPI00049492D5|nr:CpsB/CapC family capsule biosynthesis tyrosine phosphatase [Thiomicrorhabdus sp. Milos-T2]
MYDLHNHLLPGIDDGAPDLATSIELAKVAIEEGFTHMVCTPHIHPGRYDNTLDSIDNALKQFKAELQTQKLNLQVSAAAEVRIGPEILQAVKLNTLPFLGEWNNQNVLLLEFPNNMIPIGSDNLTKWLLSQNIVPIIAHPERNQAIIDNPNKLKPFLDQGCLTQLTASALTGNFGMQSKAFAEQLLLEDKITIMATDAHNKRYRRPVIQESLQIAIDLIGETKAKKLVLDNPIEITKNKF